MKRKQDTIIKPLGIEIECAAVVCNAGACATAHLIWAGRIGAVEGAGSRWTLAV